MTNDDDYTPLAFRARPQRLQAPEENVVKRVVFRAQAAQNIVKRMVFHALEPDSKYDPYHYGDARAPPKAQAAAEKARRWGEAVEMEPMNAYDRRVVHEALREVSDVSTESIEVEDANKKMILVRPVSG